MVVAGYGSGISILLVWNECFCSAGKMYSFSVHVISISLLLFTDLSNSSLTKYLNCLHSKPAPPGQNELVKKTKKEKFNNKDPSFRVNYVLNVDAIT